MLRGLSGAITFLGQVIKKQREMNGEAGIRTLGEVLPPQPLSRRLPSTSSATSPRNRLIMLSACAENCKPCVHFINDLSQLQSQLLGRMSKKMQNPGNARCQGALENNSCEILIARHPRQYLVELPKILIYFHYVQHMQPVDHKRRCPSYRSEFVLDNNLCHRIATPSVKLKWT